MIKVGDLVSYEGNIYKQLSKPGEVLKIDGDKYFIQFTFKEWFDANEIELFQSTEKHQETEWNKIARLQLGTLLRYHPEKIERIQRLRDVVADLEKMKIDERK